MTVVAMDVLFFGENGLIVKTSSGKVSENVLERVMASNLLN